MDSCEELMVVGLPAIKWYPSQDHGVMVIEFRPDLPYHHSKELGEDIAMLCAEDGTATHITIRHEQLRLCAERPAVK